MLGTSTGGGPGGVASSVFVDSGEREGLIEAEDRAHESVKSSVSNSQLSGNPEVVGGGGVVTRTEAIDS